MSPIILKSGRARAEILPERGALLSSLMLVDRNSKEQDLLWMPTTSEKDSSVWPAGGLPFLFPFAGRVWNKGELYKYELESGVFDMPLHGFSWAKGWELLSSNADQATLILTASDDTLKIFPFMFALKMSIHLSQSKLRLVVDMAHLSSKDPKNKKMPVAIGWHPYFKVASAASVAISAKTVYPVTGIGGAGLPQPALDLLGSGPWPLPNPLLSSVILSNLANPTSKLSPAPTHEVAITAGPDSIMKHVVTWTNLPTQFHCIEPWMSLPDAVASQSGCQWLEAGDSLKVWLDVECQ